MHRPIKSFVFVLVLALLGQAVPVLAANPPTEPFLRLETGMHTAMIRRVGVDAGMRLIVTSSDDKTARLWDYATGRLVRILRPPLDDGDEGKLFSVAISPDGSLVACGGWTGYDWDKSNYIYIFDTNTGRMIRRITNMPNVINHLAFSKDGRKMAAVIGGRNGVRVWSVPDFVQIGQDKKYDDRSNSVDFDSRGRLVTSCYDGLIRLYDENVRLLSTWKAPNNSRPFNAFFSPDGSKVAVGFDDYNDFVVLSGKDLSLMFRPDMKGMNSGDLSKSAWSLDGRYLYGGGKYWDGKRRPIVRWDDGGRGQRTTLPAGQDTVMHIVPLPDGGVLFGSADPIWGIDNPNGKRRLAQYRTTADYRDMQEKFLISTDGTEISFGYKVWGNDPARFSITTRTLAPGKGAGPGLNPPLRSAGNIRLTDWKNSRQPMLNGKPVPIKKYEISRSMAVMPDGSGFVLGADWYLRFFDANGKMKWSWPSPGAVWSVNIAGNGRVCIGAYADGTIRWHDIRTGKELLAFFPHKDKKRWVLWTPSGFYDASPGAEDLIGWHVNRGRDQAADFFPASRFRKNKYRPDVVEKMLETFDEGQALKLAAKEEDRPVQPVQDIRNILPPVLHILSPTSGERVSSNEIDVRYSVRSPGGEPITGVRVLIDGRPLATERAIKRRKEEHTGGTHAIKVSIPERDCEITLIAENRNAASEPASIKVRWAGKTKDAFSIKPKLYVLAVGVSDYQAGDLDLQYAAKDAKDFADTVKTQQGKLYREVEVRLLSDAGATRDDILDGLDWIERSTTQHDVAMIFLAGHGVNDKEGFYYFLPGDADTERLRRTGLPFTEIKRTVASLPGKALFFVDTCHAGNVLGGRRSANDINAVVNELSSAENGAVVFTSSSGRQYSLEDPSWGNGAFTKALIEGIKGEADYSKSGKITVNMLDLYISERVKKLTGGKQTPTTTKPETIPDFPVAVSR